MTQPTYTPPVLLHPDRSGDAGLVRETVERLRPDRLIVVGSPLASCLAGMSVCPPVGVECSRCGTVVDPHYIDDVDGGRFLLCPQCGYEADVELRPRVVIAEPDPALHAVWEAAREGRLVSATEEALVTWAAMREKCGSRAWGVLLCSEETGLVGGQYDARWALAVAAGCRDGRWERDEAGQIVSPYHESGDPDELTQHLFPLVLRHVFRVNPHYRRDAEATQSWVQAHVEAIPPSSDDAFAAADAASLNGERVLLLIDGAEYSKTGRAAITAGVDLIAWASDDTIEKWAPLQPGTQVDLERTDYLWALKDSDIDGYETQECSICKSYLHGLWGPHTRARPRRRDGITWTRRDDGTWIGQSAAGGSA